MVKCIYIKLFYYIHSQVVNYLSAYIACVILGLSLEAIKFSASAMYAHDKDYKNLISGLRQMFGLASVPVLSSLSDYSSHSLSSIIFKR